MRNLHKVPVQTHGYENVIVSASNSDAAEINAEICGFNVTGPAEPISEAQASELAHSDKTYCLDTVMTGLLP